MKRLLLFFACGSILLFGSCAKINSDLLKKGQEMYEKERPLTNDEIIKGLKEALTIGIQHSTKNASKTDAYYKNTLLFIPFPPEAQKVEKTLRNLGQNKLVNDFILTLNRAAEEAAKEASPIFIDAIKRLTISDGLKILNGSNDAATAYLRTNTNTQLHTKFKPVIEKALSKVSATKYWSDIVNNYNKIPGVEKINPDLASYTTSKATDGLYILLAQEENKIRQDPAARITDLLKRVFGHQS